MDGVRVITVAAVALPCELIWRDAAAVALGIGLPALMARGALGESFT